LGNKGGKNRLKLLAAPRSWYIPRKGRKFITKPSPGPHSIDTSYPLGVVIKNLATAAGASRELKFVLKTGKVTVDGKARRTQSFPIGLFDLVGIPLEGVSYRLVPSPKGLVLVKVGGGEANRKLCIVNTKTRVRGGHMQYGLHDGRSMVDDNINLSPGDAVLLEVPSQKVLGQVRLGGGSVGLVLSGDRAGQYGRIVEVKKGTISREKMVKISLPGGDAEIPSRLVFPVGTEGPMITVGALQQ
jgi:small subunit ribosomal protein S4e